jgi:type II secretory pathway pseudopilin PulG
MRPTDSTRAFTILELVAVCAVIGILVAVSFPAIGARILHARVAAETGELKRLADAVRASFESTDLQGTNIAALAGSIPVGVNPTSFSISTDVNLLPATTQSSDWFAKLARQLGETPALGIAPSWNLQPRVAGVLQNANHLTRILLEGPATETNQQRFLLLSLMAPSGTLALPALPNPSNAQDPANLLLFNDTWNTDWTSANAALPPSWINGLSSSQAQAWTAGSGRLWQLCVERIVCPKFSLTINDTHPTDGCYVYYNLNSGTAGSSATVGANAGVAVVNGVLGGRTVQAYRGSAPPPIAALFAQFVLRDSAEITVQD